MRYKILLAAFGLLFLGCEQKIYEKVYAPATRPLACISLKADNPITAYLLKNEYNFSVNCPFRLETFSHFVSACTSAKARFLGSDFDGYLRLELYENDRLLYRNQIDFKGCLRKELVHKLFEKLKTRFYKH